MLKNGLIDFETSGMNEICDRESGDEVKRCIQWSQSMFFRYGSDHLLR